MTDINIFDQFGEIKDSLGVLKINPPSEPSDVSFDNGAPGFSNSPAREDHSHSLARNLIDVDISASSSWTNATSTYSDITATVSPQTTLDLIAGRAYRIFFRSNFSTTVAGDFLVLGLHINGVLENAKAIHMPTTGGINVEYNEVFIASVTGPATVKMMGRRSGASTGTFSMAGIAATNDMRWYIEDLGPPLI